MYFLYGGTEILNVIENPTPVKDSNKGFFIEKYLTKDSKKRERKKGGLIVVWIHKYRLVVKYRLNWNRTGENLLICIHNSYSSCNWNILRMIMIFFCFFKYRNRCCFNCLTRCLYKGINDRQSNFNVLYEKKNVSRRLYDTQYFISRCRFLTKIIFGEWDI